MRHRPETPLPFPHFLLALDLGLKHFLPVLGTMHVPRSQLARQTVSFTVEQQQRVIAGRLKMAVVGTLLLFSVDLDFCAVHIQHHPLTVNPWPPPSPAVPD